MFPNLDSFNVHSIISIFLTDRQGTIVMVWLLFLFNVISIEKKYFFSYTLSICQ